MNKLIYFLLLSPSVFFLTGCDEFSDTSPVSIINIKEETSMEFSFGTVLASSFQIVADVDEVTITNVVINRGNSDCQKNLFSSDELPKTLKFGQVVKARYVCPLNSIREVTVLTDQGDWGFQF